MNVIVADDHAMFRKGLADTIRGIETIEHVAEVSDGNAIITLLEAQFYDVVFVGVRMNHIDGAIAAKVIHDRFPQVKTIAISQFDDTFTVKKMFLANCHGYITKLDCEEHIIREALVQVLSGRKYFNTVIGEKLTGESEEECFNRLKHQFSLTHIEFEIIQKICEGKAGKEIADEMKLSTHTIDNYRSSIYHKIGVNSSVKLVHFAIRHHIINTEIFK